jgi:hypothetical protein
MESYFNESEWSILFCPGNTKTASILCCSAPAYAYIGNLWVCENCYKSEDSRYKPLPPIEKPKKCTCGGHAIESNTHSPWCELRTIK